MLIISFIPIEYLFVKENHWIITCQEAFIRADSADGKPYGVSPPRSPLYR
jgi:hypothetical protein